MIAISCLLIAAGHAIAAERFFVCDATDGLDRASVFEVNVDSGVVRAKRADKSVWKILYSNKVSCGLKIPASHSCRRNLVHNFDTPQRPHLAATDTIRCVDRSGRPVIELNGNMEINRFGDGLGSFVCGRFSTNNLALENCKAKIE